MKYAAFLDRDGVINRSIIIDGKPQPPSVVSEVQILDGVIEAIKIIEKFDFVPVVITNQPDIARGVTTLSEVETINSFISLQTGIKHFYICPHDDSDKCDCRKPNPGLILHAVLDLDLDLKSSFLVGDRWKDIETGQALGIETYFIDYSYSERAPNFPFTKVVSLLEAVNLNFKKG